MNNENSNIDDIVEENSVHRFNSSYTILNELGRGAFSIVYKVKSIKTGKIYCVKKIRLSTTDIQKNKAKTNEITILKKLQSQLDPNDPTSKNAIHLVQYYDSYIENGFLYIIMEYCEYGDLYSLLHSVQKHHLYIQEDILWDISYQCLLALEYLHSRKIIHRDIKLLNIFMSGDKTIKIGDMGMSKIIEEDINAMNMSRVGTPLFLAPELVKKEKYDYKIDIWSLGCSLYHLAKLVPPFNEENLIKLGNAIVNDIPKELPNVYSYELKKMINALLVKNKDKRVSAREAIDKYIPSSVKNKYKEKHRIVNGNNSVSNQHKKAMSKIIIESKKNENINDNINKKTKTSSSLNNHNVISAGTFLKRQLTKTKKIDNISQVRHSYNKFNSTTQDMFNTKPQTSQSQSKVQTCNNFFTSNMNLFKMNFHKKTQVPMINENEKDKEIIFPKIINNSTANKTVNKNFAINFNRSKHNNKMNPINTPMEMRKTFNNMLNAKMNKVLTIYDLK